MHIDSVPALITGGASGLGEATARQLAAAGAKVAILDRDMDRAKVIASEINGLALACDVSKAESVDEALRMANEAHGPCGIAISCAGIAPAAKIVGRDGPMAPEDFRRVIDVNLIGTFNIMRLAAASMMQRAPNGDGERGVIINTASVAAFEGQIGQSAYAASKGGVAALTLPAARELAGKGIRVLAIAPGLFETPLLLGMPKEVQDRLSSTVPFPNRLGKPSEFAALALQMVANPYLNGETVRLDGALRMQPR